MMVGRFEQSTSLTTRRAEQLMVVLDEAANIFGGLRPSLRARIYAACEDPRSETWDDAHSIIIDSDSWTTLWQAVIRHTSYDVTDKPLNEPWPSVPTAQQIVLALRLALC